MQTPKQAQDLSPHQMRAAIQDCVEELRAALADHGIKLPSLGIDLITYASDAPYPLIALGNCRLDIARRLIDVLQEARNTRNADDGQ